MHHLADSYHFVVKQWMPGKKQRKLIIQLFKSSRRKTYFCHCNTVVTYMNVAGPCWHSLHWWPKLFEWHYKSVSGAHCLDWINSSQSFTYVKFDSHVMLGLCPMALFNWFRMPVGLCESALLRSFNQRVCLWCRTLKLYLNSKISCKKILLIYVIT